MEKVWGSPEGRNVDDMIGVGDRGSLQRDLLLFLKSESKSNG
jgi:hypothetical protein